MSALSCGRPSTFFLNEVISTDDWDGEIVEIDDQLFRPSLLKVDAFNRRQNVDPSGRYTNLEHSVRGLKVADVDR